MNLTLVEKIADTILYEGYMLYPYRPSSIKNQRRFNFGVLVPPTYSEASGGAENSWMQTQCLICGPPNASLRLKARFLQMADGDGNDWSTAIPHQVETPGHTLQELTATPFCLGFFMPPLVGTVEASAEALGEHLYRITGRITNNTPLRADSHDRRDAVLPFSLISTHALLFATNADFVSLLDPPENLRAAAAACQNLGTWPVLAGEPGEREVMLSSPIILYDYPQVAAESPGDLFDATEIDEILTLRILTLTEDEKREIREGDERSRRILERTEMLPEEHFAKLHGALRRMSAGKAT